MAGVVPREPSRTAVLTAAARALHREEPPPWVLDDPLALPLGGDDASALTETLRERLPRPQLLGFSRWVCVRARVPEDLVERAAAMGVDQYVILGAGLDSFAYRRRDLGEFVRVFEVDHPGSQVWKRQRLDEIGMALPENLVFVPVDFEHQTLRDALVAAGFDFTARSVFSWLGVTMYLTHDAIRATLDTVANCAPGTQIALTYNLPPAALEGMGLTTEAVLRELVSEMGEPMISPFTPAEIEQLLQDVGFTDVMHIGPDEARATYFPGRDDVRFGGAQRLVVATVAEARSAEEFARN